MRFSYENDKVSMIEDTIGRRICYHYEGELLTEAEYPNHGTVRYTYTPEGYLEQVTDQNGNAYVHNYYDMDGRVTRQTLSVTSAEGITVRFTYDAAGRCMSVEDGLGTKEYAYNQMDHMTRETDALGNTTKYFYDMLCNITKIVRPNQYDDKTGDGAGIRYVYDAMDEVTQWTDPLGNVYATPRDLEENVIKEINPNCYDERQKTERESAMNMTQMTSASESIIPTAVQNASGMTQTGTSSGRYSRSSMTRRQTTAQATAMNMTA